MSTGEKVRAARIAAGMTQAQLAKKLGIADVNISAVETGVRTPKIKTLKRYADALGVDVQELIDGDAMPPRVKDITPLLVVEVLTEWAKARLDDVEAATLNTEVLHSARCALALANAAEIVKTVFPEDF